MPHGMTDIVLIGTEATRGVESVNMDLHQPMVDDGLTPTLTANNAETNATSTFPDQTDDCPIGATAALRMTPDVNVNTVRDLILMATARTSGVLKAFTVQHSRVGVGDFQYLGSVVSELNMQYSRSGQPDRSSILQFDIGLECMQPDDDPTAISAGTQGVGKRFKIEKGTFTLNSVAALEVVDYRRTIRNVLDLGALNGSGARLYITDGPIEQEVNLTARFTTEAWGALLLAGTEHAAAIVHATGGSNETLTETMGKCQLRSHELSKSNGTVMQAITIRPFHTGSNPATVWTFGSAIGASVLSLP